MASESQDRDPPAQTEGSRNNEASDAGAGANENTPLLAESDPSPDEAANEHIDGNGNARDAHGRPTNNDNESTEPAALRATLSFTFMSLVFTFVTLVILFVCNVVISSVTWHPYLSYYMQDYINYLTGWVGYLMTMHPSRPLFEKVPILYFNSLTRLTNDQSSSIVHIRHSPLSLQLFPSSPPS